jgi:hypothetical protein
MTRFGNMGDLHTVPSLEVDGAPLDLGEGRVLMVRRAGGRNRTFLAAMSGVNDSTPTRELAQAVSRALLAGWSGILDQDGNALDYTPELAAELLEYAPDLIDRVVAFAAERANYAEQQLLAEIDAGKRSRRGKPAGPQASRRN